MDKIVTPQTFYFVEDGRMPNNPDLPVLVYKDVLSQETADKEKIFQRHFEKNGWKGIWKSGIWDFHHFHPDAHEAIGIARGHVTLQIGGETGQSYRLTGGDMVILPAGTGHKCAESSDNLLVVGAYPPGQENYATCRNKAEMKKPRTALPDVDLPETDPFYGATGPLRLYWAGDRVAALAMEPAADVARL